MSHLSSLWHNCDSENSGRPKMGDLSPAEELLRDEAMAFARSNKKQIAREQTDPAIYLPDAHPVSVFMAGSPGAGKTEASLELIGKLEADQKVQPGQATTRILRIDPDELRKLLPQYNGHNSYLFQGPVATLVDKVLDVAHDQDQSFLLDGTLADYGRARKNIDRCLKRRRAVQILYVYQDPVLAWQFVQAREAEEGRHIPVDRFIEQYFAARTVVNRLKSELGPAIAVDLLIKPNNNQPKVYRAGIDQIDYHVSETYDRDQLASVLGSN